VEVITVIVAVMVLAVVFLAVLAESKPKRHLHPNCISNLQQVGLALRMFSNDHGEKFPWAVSTNEGGTLEFAHTADVFRHYLALSNELSSPKVLRCPAEGNRPKASSWDQLTNNTAGLSYFTGLNASEFQPQSILSGDRNLTTNGRPAMGVISISSSTVFGFTRELHLTYGYIGLGDGSAQQVTGTSLGKQIQAALQSTNVAALRFSIPKPN
jgi:hypothetical protein